MKKVFLMFVMLVLASSLMAQYRLPNSRVKKLNVTDSLWYQNSEVVNKLDAGYSPIPQIYKRTDSGGDIYKYSIYVDDSLGNDDYDGTSFTRAKKTMQGAYTALGIGRSPSAVVPVVIFVAPGVYTTCSPPMNSGTWLGIYACDTSINNGTQTYSLAGTKTWVRNGVTNPIKRAGRVIFSVPFNTTSWASYTNTSYLDFFGGRDSLMFRWEANGNSQFGIGETGMCTFTKVIFDGNGKTVTWAGVEVRNFRYPSSIAFTSCSFRNFSCVSVGALWIAGLSIEVTDFTGNNFINVTNLGVYLGYSTEHAQSTGGYFNFTDVQDTGGAKMTIILANDFSGYIVYDTAKSTVTDVAYTPHTLQANGKTQYVYNPKMSIWDNKLKYTGIDSTRTEPSITDSIYIKTTINGQDYYIKAVR